MENNEKSDIIYKIVGVLTGIAFLGVAILILWIKESITPELFFALRLVLALGSGFVSAGISGSFLLELPKENQKSMYYVASTAGIVVKAGGPIAITVLVWVYSPGVLGLIESVVIY